MLNVDDVIGTDESDVVDGRDFEYGVSEDCFVAAILRVADNVR